MLPLIKVMQDRKEEVRARVIETLEKNSLGNRQGFQLLSVGRDYAAKYANSHTTLARRVLRQVSIALSRYPFSFFYTSFFLFLSHRITHKKATPTDLGYSPF